MPTLLRQIGEKVQIPANQFGVVRDIERNMIVDSGPFEHCSSYADHLNREYQSTAYVAELWRTNHE